MRRSAQTINRLRTALVSAIFVASAATVWAGQTFTLTFEGIPPITGDTVGSSVLSFYNADPTRQGSLPYNTTFSANALAICQGVDNGCTGGVPPSPGGGSYVGNVVDSSIEFNLTNNHLLSDLSFLYYLAAEDAKASVEFFSGEVSEGAIPLPGSVGQWLEFKGLTKPFDVDDRVTRVRFLSTTNSAVFDDIRVMTTGETSIPEPSTYALMVTSLALLAGVRRRRATY
jgi:hypothetical protein